MSSDLLPALADPAATATTIPKSQSDGKSVTGGDDFDRALQEVTARPVGRRPGGQDESEPSDGEEAETEIETSTRMLSGPKQDGASVDSRGGDRAIGSADAEADPLHLLIEAGAARVRSGSPSLEQPTIPGNDEIRTDQLPRRATSESPPADEKQDQTLTGELVEERGPESATRPADTATQSGSDDEAAERTPPRPDRSLTSAQPSENTLWPRPPAPPDPEQPADQAIVAGNSVDEVARSSMALGPSSIMGMVATVGEVGRGEPTSSRPPTTGGTTPSPELSSSVEANGPRLALSPSSSGGTGSSAADKAAPFAGLGSGQTGPRATDAAPLGAADRLADDGGVPSENLGRSGPAAALVAGSASVAAPETASADIEHGQALPISGQASTAADTVAAPASAGTAIAGPAGIESGTGLEPDSVTSPPTPVTAEAEGGDPGDPVWRQVRRAMGSLRTNSSGDQQLTIRLRPDTLGSVVVRVSSGENGTTVAVVAESTAAASQLQQQRPLLVSELESSGLSGVSIDIGRDDQTGQRQQAGFDRDGSSDGSRSGGRDSPPAPAGEVEPDPAQNHRDRRFRTPSNGLVDLDL